MDKLTAYHEWLGIPQKSDAPNYYELLGIPLFECNSNVISNGAARCISFLQSMVASEYAELAQEIQKEVAQAKICLMREVSRNEYQNRLMQRLASYDAEHMQRAAESTFTPSVNLDHVSFDQFLNDTRNFHRRLSLQNIWLIGSAPECDLIIKNQFISRKHCLLFRYENRYEVEDWASTNGTYVNNEMLTPRVRKQISTTDVVTLGKVTLMPWPPVDNQQHTARVSTGKIAAAGQ
jgi:hypothetical protein